MTTVGVIERKRDGHEHSREEIESLVMGFVRGEVRDYQIAAWLMAAFLNGMTDAETFALTEVMAASGERLDLSGLPRTVDKHSTGGVGDKTSLVLGPILAACGLTVAKMSGRGLAHTGGTIDKLEALPGWRATLSEDEFMRQAREVGLVIVGQSRELAPADGLLYALRDVTGTVASVPLIASSIMSKKLAAGASTIVLDVKVGAGAFMGTLERARELARAMLAIAARAGRSARAVITDMDAPLGRAAGNALEVREALETLHGRGPEDLRELCFALAEEALLAAGEQPEAAAARPREALASGAALGRFRRFAVAQGGDPAAVDDPSRLAVAAGREAVAAPAAGWLERVDALAVGRAVLALGGGRARKEDLVDLGVGVELLALPGERLEPGRPVATIVHRDGRGLDQASALLAAGIRVSAKPAGAPPLVLERLNASVA